LEESTGLEALLGGKNTSNWSHWDLCLEQLPRRRPQWGNLKDATDVATAQFNFFCLPFAVWRKLEKFGVVFFTLRHGLWHQERNQRNKCSSGIKDQCSPNVICGGCCQQLWPRFTLLQPCTLISVRIRGSMLQQWSRCPGLVDKAR
jgi:hypothetical protein